MIWMDSILSHEKSRQHHVSDLPRLLPSFLGTYCFQPLLCEQTVACKNLVGMKGADNETVSCTPTLQIPSCFDHKSDVVRTVRALTHCVAFPLEEKFPAPNGWTKSSTATRLWKVRPTFATKTTQHRILVQLYTTVKLTCFVAWFLFLSDMAMLRQLAFLSRRRNTLN